MMTVSLCVVAYNEEAFLPNLLKDLSNQTYPHELIEIVLIDGGSFDRTREIMEEFKVTNDTFMSIQVLDNPKKIQAAGWNVAIINAIGDVIIRIDAHTHIPVEFTTKNMALQESGEYVTGGIRPCLIEKPTAWKNTLLEVENSLFGSSISKSRHSNKKQYVKSMFHAAYRREVFEKVGFFNEKLLRTEDNEIHYRIRKAGYKLCFDPEIISYQYARSSLKKMIKQKYGNGYWIGLTIGVCPRCISVYHLVPLAFILGIVFTSIMTALGFWQLGVIMWAVYLSFTVISTIISIINNEMNKCILCMPFLFLVLHVCYGIGTAVGLSKLVIKGGEI